MNATPLLSPTPSSPGQLAAMLLRWWRKYQAVTEINLRNTMTYLKDVAIRSLFMGLILYVFVELWRVTYSSHGAGGRVAGLTLRQMVWYFCLTETVMTGRLQVGQTIGQEVRDGTITYLLNRPLNYLLYRFCAGLGEALPRLIVHFALGATLITIMVGPPAVDIVTGVVVAASLFLALCLDYVITAGIGLLAFVIEDTSSLLLIYQKLLFTLGGMFVPLELYPGWLSTLSHALPFNLIQYAPALLFVHFSAASATSTLLSQTIWLIVLSLAVTGLYHLLVRRVSINGG